MKDKINVAELLKDCPKGMELNCIMYNKVTLLKVDEDAKFPIKVSREDGAPILITKYGQYTNADFAKCIIFPKGKTTLEGFVPPCKFKDGDVLFVDCSDDEEDKSYQYIFILNKPEFTGKWHSYCYLNGVGDFDSKETYLTDDEYHPRFATEEEKQKLFNAIKDNGYKWNAETKSLEKLPKFKVGDKVQHKEENMKEELEQITLDIPKGYEFFGINDDNQVVLTKKQMQYPKTYKECCEMIGYEPNRQSVTGYLADLIEKFQQLIICRYAYWKIGGEPDIQNNECYCLYYSITDEAILKQEGYLDANAVLTFPTREIRNAFYENFKELINETKELL